MTLFSRTVFILLVPALFAAGTLAQTVTKTVPKSVYNAAKDETITFLSPEFLVDAGWGELTTFKANADASDASVDEPARMMVFYRSKGSAAAAPEKIIFTFEIGSYRGYRFVKNRDFSIKADKVETEYGQAEAVSRRQDGATRFPGHPNYWETLELSIPLADYLRIVEAKKVKFVIGGTRIDLSKDKIEALKSIADKKLK